MTNDNGGDATIDLSDLQCLSGNASGLQGVVLSAGTACDPTTYSAVSNCEHGSASGFSLSATGLSNNTQYWVQVDGAAASECDFTIEVSGPAVNMTASATSTDKTCGGTGGQVDVTNTSGGTAPYTYSLNGGSYQASNSFTGLAAGSYSVTVKDDNGCTVMTNSVVVGQINPPDAGTVDTVSATCSADDGEIHLTNIMGGQAPYQFDLNGDVTQTDSSFTGVAPGTQQIVVTGSDGCTDTVNLILENEDGITQAATSTTTADCGQSNGSASVDNVTGGAPPYSYQWNDGNNQATQTAMDLPAGTYDVTITDDNSCTFTVNNVSVPETPPDTASVSITATPNPSCPGDDVTFTATTNNASTSSSVEWYLNGGQVQSGGNTYTNGALSDGDQVHAELVDPSPCFYPDTAVSNTVTVARQDSHNPALTLSADKTEVCDNETTTFTMDTTDAGRTPTFRCYSDGSEIYSGTETSFSVTGLSDGVQVSCEVTPEGNCSATATSNSVTMSVTEFTGSVGPDKVIGEEESTDLSASGGSSYTWEPASSLSSSSSATPTASPQETTTYFVNVTYEGCDTTLDQTVKVIKLIQVPNTFTPNGDGYNDTWKIQRIKNYENSKVTVYDRWGQRVFHSIGYNDDQRWDGTRNGRELPAATYYYVIDLNREEEGGKDVFKGSVTIIY